MRDIELSKTKISKYDEKELAFFEFGGFYIKEVEIKW